MARAQQAPGYCYSLGLAFAKAAATLAKHGIQSVGEFLDKIGAGGMKGLF